MNKAGRSDFSKALDLMSTYADVLFTYDGRGRMLCSNEPREEERPRNAQEASVEAVAPGLDLYCRGIRRTSPDDFVAIERGAILYEAIYAQLAAETQPA